MKSFFRSFLFLCIVALNSSMVAAMDNPGTPRSCLKRKSDALKGDGTLTDITNRDVKRRKIDFKCDTSLVQVYQYEVNVEEKKNRKNYWVKIASNITNNAINEKTTKVDSDSETERTDSDSENDDATQRLPEQNMKKNLELGNSNPEQVRAQYPQKPRQVSKEILEMPIAENLELVTTFLLDSNELCERYEQTRSQALGNFSGMGICDFYDDM